MFLRKELEWVRRSPKAQTSKSKARIDRFFAAEADAPPPSEGEMDLVVRRRRRRWATASWTSTGVTMEFGGRRLVLRPRHQLRQRHAHRHRPGATASARPRC
jgi:ATP-binding cassette subfamily F protein uup